MGVFQWHKIIINTLLINLSFETNLLNNNCFYYKIIIKMAFALVISTIVYILHEKVISFFWRDENMNR